MEATEENFSESPEELSAYWFAQGYRGRELHMKVLEILELREPMEDFCSFCD